MFLSNKNIMITDFSIMNLKNYIDKEQVTKTENDMSKVKRIFPFQEGVVMTSSFTPIWIR